MVDSIVTNGRSDIKGDYPTAYESMCAKLHQAQTISMVIASNDMPIGYVQRLGWCLSDLLTVACAQAEALTASDFKSIC